MEIPTAIFYSLFAGSATLVGLALTLLAGNFVKRYSFAIVSVAAGVLLGTAFLHIIPEAEAMIGQDAFLWLLLGFGAFYIMESLIGCHCSGDKCRHGEADDGLAKKACSHEDGHGHKHSCSSEHSIAEHDHRENHALGSIAAAGLFFHSILDGVAIAVGFEVSTTLGIITAFAVIIHELPEGIFTFSILLHSGMKKKKAFWWSVLVALATPFGAVMTLLLFPNLNESILGILLAVAAGSFLYIAAVDLLPETHKKRSLVTGAFVFLGLLLMFAVNNFAGHDHTNHNHALDEDCDCETHCETHDDEIHSTELYDHEVHDHESEEAHGHETDESQEETPE